MSGFDPLTYSVAREAKLPAGTLLPSFAADPAVVGAGWAHLDGSLVSRSMYPNAVSVVGDVRFFDGTPVLTASAQMPPAGRSYMGSHRSIAVGSSFVVAAGVTGPPANATLRAFQSPDAGESWTYADINCGAYDDITPEKLEWFGAGRLLMVLKAYRSVDGQQHTLFSVSNDLGKNWSAGIVMGGYNVASICISADAQMLATGDGYYYVAGQLFMPSAVGLLYAINPRTNAVREYSQNLSSSGTNLFRVLGGRVTGVGVSEITVAQTLFPNAPGPGKLTFNGTDFVASASGLNYSSDYFDPDRSYVVRSNGNDFVALPSTGAVYKMPANWSGTPTKVHQGFKDVGARLVSNTLSNPETGLSFNLVTSTESRLAGAAAGPSPIGAQYGWTNKVWVHAPDVVDKTSSADRHLMQIGGLAGSLAVRSMRCSSNFMGGFAGTADAARFLTYPTTPSLRWYDPATGVFKTLAIELAGAALSLSVSSYSAAQDYSNYVHMPYLPGLVCRLR